MNTTTPDRCADNYGLPAGITPHNPAGLTPEQVGHGYRLLADVEIYIRYSGKFLPDIHMWYGGEWDETSWNGSKLTATYRVPASWPLDPDPAKAPPSPAWRLPDPPPGMQWHRTDWTEEMLPDGYRPLLLEETGECEVFCGDEWFDLTKSEEVIPTLEDHDHCRTRRPLPVAPASQPALAKASDRQEGGRHYKGLAIQPAEFITRNGLNFLEGSVMKRICRHRQKAGAEDIRKAIHELQLILEYEYPGQ